MVSLSRGDDSLVLAPKHGGTIVGWTRRGTHMLRRPSPEAVLLGHPGAMGCFPLIPYCNRIAYRRFNWAGQTHELSANFGDRPHAIHGVGWQRPWQVEDVSPDSATFSLHHDASGDSASSWPFAFLARLNKELSESGEFVASEGLGLPDQAKVVRGRKNGAPVTDGVFPEAKEFLLGYWIVDVETPERAYEIAARLSTGPGPGGAELSMPIEVRQIMSRRTGELP